MSKTHKIDADILEAARVRAELLMDNTPALRELWMDENRTSSSTDKNGYIALKTDYDWIVAFFVWWTGGALPREPLQRTSEQAILPP